MAMSSTEQARRPIRSIDVVLVLLLLSNSLDQDGEGAVDINGVFIDKRLAFQDISIDRGTADEAIQKVDLFLERARTTSPNELLNFCILKIKKKLSTEFMHVCQSIN